MSGVSERFYTILSSAPTMSAINQAVTDFYAGSVKEFRPMGDGYWQLFNANGTPLMGVHVRTKRGRYLFVTTEK